jgi:UDP-GlcNAc:undecaprenyl-phosphate/decaprenyl-phosphate GlcNAc-1-phosphate transferase
VLYLMYLLIFLLGSLSSLVLTRSVRDLAHSQGWLDKPAMDRHVHTTPMPRIGGLAILLSFAVALAFAFILQGWFPNVMVLYGWPMLRLVGPAFIVFLLGLYDDLRGVSPYSKFLIQAFAASLLYFGGYGVHRVDLLSSGHSLQTFIGLPLTVFWVLLITNAFNLIDGLDGLAAGSALFSTTIVFILALWKPNLMVGIIAVALVGAMLGFLRFNFHPASIFLGDSGSLFIGFMISAIAIAGFEKAPTMIAVAIPVVSLGLPILDVGLAVSRRFLRGSRLFEGDRDHIHHKLLKRGLSQREAVLLLYAVTAAFGFLSLLLLHHATAIALTLAATGVGALIGVRQLQYAEFDEILSIVRRSTHRRQFVTNHVAVRRAVDSLNDCDNFSSLCRILQAALQPIGFDGFRFQMLHPNGFAASSFHPMSYEPDGKLSFSWSASDINNPPWELRLELVGDSGQCWGYFSLIRLAGHKAMALDLDVLTLDFRTALSKAVENSCAALEPCAGDDNIVRPAGSRRASAGSSSH